MIEVKERKEGEDKRRREGRRKGNTDKKKGMKICGEKGKLGKK